MPLAIVTEQRTQIPHYDQRNYENREAQRILVEGHADVGQ